MTFGELRMVWSGTTQVIVRGYSVKNMILDDYPFDMVVKYPWLDDCEVWSIDPEQYLQSDEHSSCRIIVDYKG